MATDQDQAGRESAFTANEIAYLQGQRLGRLATLGARGEPHVVPVGFRYNPTHDSIDIGGRSLATSKKYRDVVRDGRVAFVVDDVPPPWQPRGIEIRGQAEIAAEGGKEIHPDMESAVIRIRPVRIVAWGLESSNPFQRNSRSVV
jgi:pyridoxamine 5'-phosphate oxidase family protein